ncbi:hypothetical protein LBMAG42_00280 [Deltaproteobacteria bacterium]|nr:hypothetical protein LBMAG42_00280 [Deltaproteobacteria bacterium]
MRTLPLFLLLLAGCPEVEKDTDTATQAGEEGLKDEDGDGYTTEDGDCDDGDKAISPEGIELCDGRDNDCDGVVDNDAGGLTFYADTDGDGFGDPDAPTTACEQPEGTSINATDCDDADPDTNPAAEEVDCADPADHNCDGLVTYPDADTDGFDQCVDCDDADPAVFPGAVELCNGTDDDCDGVVDPDSAADAPLWYADTDTDTYGDPAVTTAACSAPAGFVGDDTDCDDTVTTINPAALELCDAFDVDEDCDGLTGDADPDVDPASELTWYADADVDGYGDAASTTSACAPPAGFVADNTDCNDADALYHPGASELDCSDPNDYNCDGSTLYADDDADGFAACMECDDGSAAVYPGATELCNGIDDDCDGVIDPDSASDAATWYADTDLDSFGDAASTAPGCTAPAGYVGDSTDCDDAVATTYPGAPELCNGVDDDCDGTIDPDSSTDALTWYADADADGFGDASATTLSCAEPVGFLADNTDCDDTSATVYPGAYEYCNGIDDDCDGVVDPDSSLDSLTWYADSDGDTYGDAATTTLACDVPAGFVADNLDCNDADAAINPAATEVCDAGNVDEDCDGLSDDDDPSVDRTTWSTWYMDADGDTYGDPAVSTGSCEAPAGYITDGTDCDDTRAAVHPGGVEICEALDADEDCDGLADDDDPSANPMTMSTWYVDADSDSYGTSVSVDACDIPAGYASTDGDCDDADANINPGEAEVCDALDVDEDCNGLADDDDPGAAGLSTWYRDADGDTYGDPATTTPACSQPSGYLTDDQDCDDTDPAINPAALETCDGVDEDCDGTVDDACSTLCSDLVVLVYTDYGSWTSTTCPSSAGANRTGASVTFTTSAATFYSSVTSLVPDVAIVDVPSSSLSTSVASGVNNQIAAGGYVLFSFWDLDNSSGSTMRTALGVTTSDIYTPQAMASSSTGTLWNINDTLPASIYRYSHNANDNGDILTATSASTSEVLAYYGGTTTNAAIIATNSGQTIVNGFLSYDWQNTDDDSDGVKDMHELYSNEIIWITGCTP